MMGDRTNRWAQTEEKTSDGQFGRINSVYHNSADQNNSVQSSWTLTTSVKIEFLNHEACNETMRANKIFICEINKGWPACFIHDH